MVPLKQILQDCNFVESAGGVPMVVHGVATIIQHSATHHRRRHHRRRRHRRRRIRLRHPSQRDWPIVTPSEATPIIVERWTEAEGAEGEGGEAPARLICECHFFRVPSALPQLTRVAVLVFHLVAAGASTGWGRRRRGFARGAAANEG